MGTSQPSPADRGHLLTEQRAADAHGLDALSVRQMLQTMNDADGSVPRAVRQAIPQLEKLVRAVVRGVRQGGRLIYLGAGTSGRLGVLDASECSPTFCTDPRMVVGIIAGGDQALRRSSEGKEDDWTGALHELQKLSLNAHDTILGIAAGGTTPYVLGGLAIARTHHARTALLTCVHAEHVSQHWRHHRSDRFPAQQVIELLVGPEVLTGSTRLKAGTATKLALNMITTTLMVQLGKCWGNLMVDVRVSNQKLYDRAMRILRSQIDADDDHLHELLRAAQGSVKLALVMGRKGWPLLKAQRRLTASRGHLRPILGDPR